MLRRFAMGRTSYAALDVERALGEDLPETGGPRGLAALRRAALAPLEVLAAAVAALVFLVLLPICGIASIAENVARSCWRSARGAPARPGCDIRSQD